MSKGQLFIVSAPSGAGKTTLVRGLLARDAGLRLSVSTTTRAPRAGEKEGREYSFISFEEFSSRRDAGEFLEWAEVHGNCYGTSREWIRRTRNEGHDVLLEIDWQGAQQVRSHFSDTVSIFILPPSFEELARRLTGRGSDSAEVIQRRLAAALSEMRRVTEFDYVIINDDLEQALTALQGVVSAARHGVAAQLARHPEWFEFLNLK